MKRRVLAVAGIARATALAAVLAAALATAGCGPDAAEGQSGGAARDGVSPPGGDVPVVDASMDDATRASVEGALRAAEEGRHEDVAGLLAEVLSRPDPPAGALWIAGWAAYELGDFAVAVDRLGAAVRAQPAFLPHAVALGFAQRRLGRVDDAAATFRSIVEVRPDAYKAHYGLGLLALDAGRAAEARPHLERALALQPDYLKAEVAMARLLQRENRLDEARVAFEAVVKRAPSHEEALYRLAQVLDTLGRADEAQAVLEQQRKVYAIKEQIGALVTAIRAGGADADAFRHLAGLFAEIGADDDAQRAVADGLRRFPGDAILVELRDRLAAPER